MVLDTSALNTLLEVIGGDKASLVELIESFEDDAPRLMRQMKEASAASSPELLGRAAHTMKSSARDFGAAELSQLCATLEHQCKTGQLSGAPELVAAIEPEFTSAMTALRAYKATCKIE